MGLVSCIGAEPESIVFENRDSNRPVQHTPAGISWYQKHGLFRDMAVLSPTTGDLTVSICVQAMENSISGLWPVEDPDP